MGTLRGLASGGALFLGFLVFGQSQARAATYDTGDYLIGLVGSYGNINPYELNKQVGQVAPLHDLVGGRLTVERGLYGLKWTHWIEVGYYASSAYGEDIDTTTGFLTDATQTISFISVIPAGATLWFERSSILDLGVSVGLGLGFATQNVVTKEPISHVVKIPSTYSTNTGGVGFLAEGHATARIWLSNFFAIPASVGLRYYNASLTNQSTGTSVSAALFSYEVTVGLNFAIGGIKGRGTTFIEVLHNVNFSGLDPKAANPQSVSVPNSGSSASPDASVAAGATTPPAAAPAQTTSPPTTSAEPTK